jgi:hypothetical protein
MGIRPCRIGADRAAVTITAHVPVFCENSAGLARIDRALQTDPLRGSVLRQPELGQEAATRSANRLALAIDKA